MSEDDQCIEMAKLAGWTNIHFKSSYHGTDGGWYGNHPEITSFECPIPDYMYDLNAVHMVESKLTDNQYSVYYVIICDMEDILRPMSTPAKKRTEAILKSLEKWKQ